MDSGNQPPHLIGNLINNRCDTCLSYYNVHKLLQIKGIDGCPFCRQDEDISSWIL